MYVTLQPAVTQAYLQMAYPYTLAEELSASEVRPLHQRKLAPITAACAAAVQAVVAGAAGTEHWRVLADAANLTETLLDMGEFDDPDHLFRDGVAAVVTLSRLHGDGAPMCLRPEQLEHLQDFCDAYVQMLQQTPARTYIRAHRATERRVRELLLSSYGSSETHEFIVI